MGGGPDKLGHQTFKSNNMNKAFKEIQQSIAKSKSTDDLKMCFKMITSFKRFWKYSLEGPELENQLIEILLDKQEIICL